MGFDLVKLIETVGYLGLFLIIFAESGLFFGFFFPGDSLLLTAGLLASRGILDIRVLIPLLFVAAVLGDNIGYWFGAKTGPILFTRPNSLLFKRENLLKAHAFYEKHGGKTITLARWVPVVRTFVPIVAGAAAMDYRRFFMFNILGAFLWAVGMPLLGFGLGIWFGSIEGVDKYFTILVLLFFFVPGIPTLIHLWRENREKLFNLFRTRVLRREPAASAPEADEASVTESELAQPSS
jgi:membrane-associated protein